MHWKWIQRIHALMMIATTGLGGILKGRLTKVNSLISKEEMNWLRFLVVELPSRKLSYCPLMRFGFDMENNGSALQGRVSRQLLSCFLDYLLRGSLVSRESNKSRLQDSEKLSMLCSLGIRLRSCCENPSCKRNYGPLEAFH